jgi:hypothetical protein
MAVRSLAPPSRGWSMFVVAVVAPVAILALSYALWWVDDQLLVIGPFDRAQFWWIFAFPLLLLAPLVAGFASARLAEREANVALVLAGTAVGLGLALLFWRSVADPHCPTGNVYAPSDWVGPSLIVGAAFAASLTVSGLVTSWFVREGRRVAAVVVGTGLDLLLLAGVLVIAGMFLVRPACERPIPTG